MAMGVEGSMSDKAMEVMKEMCMEAMVPEHIKAAKSEELELKQAREYLERTQKFRSELEDKIEQLEMADLSKNVPDEMCVSVSDGDKIRSSFDNKVFAKHERDCKKYVKEYNDIFEALAKSKEWDTQQCNFSHLDAWHLGNMFEALKDYICFENPDGVESRDWTEELNLVIKHYTNSPMRWLTSIQRLKDPYGMIYFRKIRFENIEGTLAGMEPFTASTDVMSRIIFGETLKQLNEEEMKDVVGGYQKIADWVDREVKNVQQWRPIYFEPDNEKDDEENVSHFRRALCIADSDINLNCGRGAANTYLTGAIGADWFKQHPKWEYHFPTSVEDAYESRLVGFCDGKAVIYSPHVDNTEIICLYKSLQIPHDAPMVAGVYAPVHLGNQKGMKFGAEPLKVHELTGIPISKIAFKNVNPFYVKRITIK